MEKSLWQERIRQIPALSGVYLMKDENGKVIYIGKALNLRSRVRSYFSNKKSFKNQFLIPKTKLIDYIVTDTEVSACLLEANLVKKHKPRYNIRLKDDKAYPYIRLSIEENYPRFYIERKAIHKKSLYFGPYAKAFLARQMISFLNEHLKIRDCSNSFMKSRKKPCLSYDIGRCSAPCVNKISKENYLKQVKKGISFFKVKEKSILKYMQEQLESLSREERFEEAIALRDRIKAIRFCGSYQFILSSEKKDMDVVVFYPKDQAVLFQILHIRSGSVIGQRFYFENFHSWKAFLEPDFLFSFLIQYYMENKIPDLILLSDNFKSSTGYSVLVKSLAKLSEKKPDVRSARGKREKTLIQMALQNAKIRFKEQHLKQESLLKGLMDIQKKFRLKEKPERIECFDVSHFQGSDMVASQVVFENGLPKKADYRRYKIRQNKIADDFASLREVLSRRFRHKEYKEPQLVVVDGGKGQLSAGVQALRDKGMSHIPIVALAKAKVKSDFSSKQVQSSPERFFLPNRKNACIFPPNSEAFRILVHLRNEAHRFAVSYHRRLSHQLNS